MSGAYVLWQRPAAMRRVFAAAWADWFAQPGGVDEAAAREAGTVVLVGAPDFFPSTPFAAGTVVWRIKPRPGDDPEELEPMFQAILEDHGEPTVERDPRAVMPREPTYVEPGEDWKWTETRPVLSRPLAQTAQGEVMSDAGETPVAAVAAASTAVAAASAMGADAPVGGDDASAVIHDAPTVSDYAAGTATDAPVVLEYAPAEEGLRGAAVAVERATYDVRRRV